MRESWLFGEASAMIAPIISVTMMFPVVAYVVARWRGNRDGGPVDTQLGFKTVVYYFLVLGIQLALFGLFLVLAGLISSRDGSDETREGAALLISGGLVAGLHSWLLWRSNNKLFPIIGRMFLGLNLFIVGLVAMVALVIAASMLFAKDDAGDFGRDIWALLGVYGVAWFAYVFDFARRVGVLAPTTDGGAIDRRVGPPPA